MCIRDRLSDVRQALEKGGIDNPYLQIINVNSQQDTELKSILSIRTKFIEEGSADQDKITNIIDSEFTSPQLVQVSSVGPTLGMEPVSYTHLLHTLTAKKLSMLFWLMTACRIIFQKDMQRAAQFL